MLPMLAFNSFFFVSTLVGSSDSVVSASQSAGIRGPRTTVFGLVWFDFTVLGFELALQTKNDFTFLKSGNNS